MEKEEFSKRLSQLRVAKGISARDMSLSLGQSAGYINNIENNVSLPSMIMFFYICEFLNITPQEFFDIDNVCPPKSKDLYYLIKKLSPEQIQHISAVIKDILNR